MLKRFMAIRCPACYSEKVVQRKTPLADFERPQMNAQNPFRGVRSNTAFSLSFPDALVMEFERILILWPNQAPGRRQ
jgi:hypothetical protein